MIGVLLENRRICRCFPDGANSAQAALRGRVRGRSALIVRHGGGVFADDDPGIETLLAVLEVRREIFEMVRDLLVERGARDAERQAHRAADFALALAETGDVRATGLPLRSARRIARLIRDAAARRGLLAPLPPSPETL